VRRHCWGLGSMATQAPTVAAVMQKSFSRANIVEALELFGVRANTRTSAKAFKVQLVQLIQDQAMCSVVGDGMLVDSAPAHAPAAAVAITPGAKPSAVTEGLLGCLASVASGKNSRNFQLHSRIYGPIYGPVRFSGP
jgi:hypothetical protein